MHITKISILNLCSVREDSLFFLFVSFSTEIPVKIRSFAILDLHLEASGYNNEILNDLINAAPPEKRLRFKTTTDASEKQVIEAMQKIASHIKNPSKFSKASKLAIQLIQAGSIKETTSGYFFAVLEAAMSSSTSCSEPSLRAHYHALFSAAEDVAEVRLHTVRPYISLL